jgi:hypothetical protein
MLATLARDLELDTLTVEQDDRVLLVRFCDPPHNYMTARMQKDLDILTAAVDADIRVGAAVLGPLRSHAAYRCKELIRGGAAPADPLADPKLPSMKSLAYSESPTAPKRLQGSEQDRKGRSNGEVCIWR